MEVEKSVDKALPYGTTSDNVKKLLEAIKAKEGSEKNIAAVYSGTKFDSTRKALELLGVVTGLNLTDIGRKLAFSNDASEQQRLYLCAVLSYAPYELFLAFQRQQNNFSKETTADDVINYWGRQEYGNSANNRNEGVSVFFSFLELAGLGKYVIGRKGKNTRFEWNDDVVQKIDSVDKNTQSTDRNSSNILGIPEDDVLDIDKEIIPDEKLEDERNPIPPHHVLRFKYPMALSEKVPQISITVDMSNWDIEKIESFFKTVREVFM